MLTQRWSTFLPARIPSTSCPRISPNRLISLMMAISSLVSSMPRTGPLMRAVLIGPLSLFARLELVLAEQDPALQSHRRTSVGRPISTVNVGTSRQLCDKASADTLVLLAVHGYAIVRERLGIQGEAAVIGVEKPNADPLSHVVFWLDAQMNDLPQVAEAMPNHLSPAFIEADLNRLDPQISGLVAPSFSGIFGDCQRTGMMLNGTNRALRSLMLERPAIQLADALEDNHLPLDGLCTAAQPPSRHSLPLADGCWKRRPAHPRQGQARW